MRAHQSAGVERIVGEMRGRALVAYEQGCGKTWVALASAKRLGPGPLLVVCPKKMLKTWVAEARDREAMRLDIVRTAKEPLTEHCVMTYAMARLRDDLRDVKWHTVILDESHLIKGFDSEQGVRLRTVAAEATHALLLSGTPEMSCPAELWAQLHAVAPGRFGCHRQFTARYCDGHMDDHEHWTAKGATNIDELRERMAPYYLRVLKSDVLGELPPKTRAKVLLTLSSDDVTEFAQLRRQRDGLRRRGERGDQRAKVAAEHMFTEAWRLTGERKCAPGLAWVRDVLMPQIPGEKVILFHHHQRVGDAAEAAFPGAARIDGSTPEVVQQARIEELRAKGSGAAVGILSMSACGAGITLCPGAAVVVFLEEPLTPALALQCEDRLHRIGTDRPVKCFYLVGQGSFDEDVMRMLERKQKTNARVLDDAPSDFVFDVITPAV